MGNPQTNQKKHKRQNKLGSHENFTLCFVFTDPDVSISCNVMFFQKHHYPDADKKQNYQGPQVHSSQNHQCIDEVHYRAGIVDLARSVDLV
ncbi:UNVERIFIED_CONTAM: hypothetical protein FKN15_050701 [Acipenser sinensis]